MKPGQNFSHDSERWGRSVFGHFFSEKRERLVTMNLRVLSLFACGESQRPASLMLALISQDLCWRGAALK